MDKRDGVSAIPLTLDGMIARVRELHPSDSDDSIELDGTEDWLGTDNTPRAM